MSLILTAALLASPPPERTKIHLLAHDSTVVAIGTVAGPALELRLRRILRDRTPRGVPLGEPLPLADRLERGTWLVFLAPSARGGFTGRALRVVRQARRGPRSKTELWAVISDPVHGGLHLPRTLEQRVEPGGALRFSIASLAALMNRPVRRAEYDP